jgi:hypothetical protein
MCVQPEQLPAGVTLAELLQLAMNSSSHAVAAAAAQHVPAQLEPEAVRWLLVTAATRRHDMAVQHLCSLPAAKEMSSEQVAAVLLTALQHGSTACALIVIEDIPAVALLTADMKVPLLLADEGQGCAKRLLTSSEQLVEVLQAAVQHGSVGCIYCIRMHPLPAAQALSNVQVVELLNAAVNDDKPDCLFELCGLVGGVELASKQVLPAVKVAITNQRAGCLEHLCRLRAVHDLSRVLVAGLLQFSARCGSAACLQLLCRLPAAECLDSTDVWEAMVAATQAEDDLGKTDCMLHLCLLPAASCLTSMQLEQLLAKAVGIGSVGCTELLCQLAAAAGLGGAAIARLVLAAEKQGAGGCAQQLRSLINQQRQRARKQRHPTGS